MDIFHCNNCMCVIADDRFKCMDCHDFDLCKPCCSLDRLSSVVDGLHDHESHTFLKIATSQTSTNALEEGVMIMRVLDAMELLLLDCDTISAQGMCLKDSL